MDVVNADYIDLRKSVFVGKYTTGGVIDRVLQIKSVANNGAGLIRIETTTAHAYETADAVDIPSLPGVSAGVAQWLIEVIDSTHYDLVGSAFSGAYSGGGTCLRYFAGMRAQTIAIGPSFPDYRLRAFANGDLRIKNAVIDLISSGGGIFLDPTTPSIIVNKQGVGSIVIDASIPNITMYDALGNPTIKFDPNGGTTIDGIPDFTTTVPPNTRTIATTTPLTGGGDLSANRTLAVSLATTSTVGVVKADGTSITVDGAGKISAAGKGDGVAGSITVIVGPLLTDTKTLTFTATGCLASIT